MTADFFWQSDEPDWPEIASAHHDRWLAELKRGDVERAAVSHNRWIESIERADRSRRE